MFLGLGGKTAFLDFGNLSYLKPNPRMEKIYDIKQFLQYTGRDSNNAFIFGGGISQRPSNEKLGEVLHIIVDTCNI